MGDFSAQVEAVVKLEEKRCRRTTGVLPLITSWRRRPDLTSQASIWTSYSPPLPLLLLLLAPLLTSFLLSLLPSPLDSTKQPFVIGFSGGMALGKTIVCDMIIQQLHDHRIVLVN